MPPGKVIPPNVVKIVLRAATRRAEAATALLALRDQR